MKTTFLCAVAALAAVLLVSATVWEGVTDVAFAKDLPRAYSMATNSFPRNTVVDVTNLENGKMVRVIVISGLETTGLLATLSRKAADAIDLRHDSTCRIRMTQPSVNASQHARAGAPPPVLQLGPIDASGAIAAAENESTTSRPPATESAPVAATNRPAATESTPAASRPPATESAPAASRTPATESAPAASRPAATESAPAASRPAATESAAATSRPAATESAPVASRTPATESAPAASRPAATESAPAASRTPATESVTTTTRTTVTETVTTTNRPAATENAPVASRAPATVSITAADEPAATDDVIAVDEPAVTDNVIAADEPAVTDDIIAIAEPAAADDITAVDESPVTDNVAVGRPAEAVTENQPEPRIASGTLVLIPADERLPPAHEQPATASRDTAPNGVTPRTAAPGEVAPNGAAPRNTASKDAPPPITQTTETPAAYAPPSDFSPFQAPLISSLERGKWYVQLGVYTRPDNVEDEIIRIGSAYPVAIQNIGTDTSPMFRVLLGPLNQGESGAMLQRFKSIGYADAFVRYN